MTTLHPGVASTPFHLIQAWSIRHTTHRRRTQLVAVPAVTAVGVVTLLAAGGPRWPVTVAATVAVMVVPWLLYRLHPGWLWSVTARPRWTYLGLLTATAAGATAMMLLPYITPTGAPVSWPVVAVAVAAGPVIAVAQEVVFRGWMLQAFARAARYPAVAVTASAVIYGTTHLSVGAPSVEGWVWFTMFGLIAGTVTVATGGIEAAVAMHAAHATITPVLLAAHGHRPLLGADAATLGWGFTGTAIAVTTLLGVFAVWLHRTWRLTNRTTPGYHYPTTTPTLGRTP